jgi:hypothetical protein
MWLHKRISWVNFNWRLLKARYSKRKLWKYHVALLKKEYHVKSLIKELGDRPQDKKAAAEWDYNQGFAQRVLAKNEALLNEIREAEQTLELSILSLRSTLVISQM